MGTKKKTGIRVAYLTAPTLFRLNVLVNQAVERGAELHGEAKYLPLTTSDGHRLSNCRGWIFTQTVVWGRAERTREDMTRMIALLRAEFPGVLPAPVASSRPPGFKPRTHG
jgi:hypothetical protein